MHTQGQWSVNDNVVNEVVADIGGRDEHVAMTRTAEDARLIAAAPDLLEALRAIAAVPGRYDVCPSVAFEMYELARQAIAKAKGG